MNAPVHKFQDGEIFEVPDTSTVNAYYGKREDRPKPGERWILSVSFSGSVSHLRSEDGTRVNWPFSEHVTNPRFWVHIASPIPSVYGKPCFLGEGI